MGVGHSAVDIVAKRVRIRSNEVMFELNLIEKKLHQSISNTLVKI